LFHAVSLDGLDIISQPFLNVNTFLKYFFKIIFSLFLIIINVIFTSFYEEKLFLLAVFGVDIA